MGSYEKSGKIGNIRPRNAAHARKIASAIAYKEQGLTESMLSFIDSFDADRDLMEAIKAGFKACFEADDEQNVVDLQIPTNANPEDIAKVQATTTDALNKLKTASEQKAELDKQIASTKDTISKVTDEMKARNAATATTP